MPISNLEDSLLAYSSSFDQEEELLVFNPGDFIQNLGGELERSVFEDIETVQIPVLQQNEDNLLNFEESGNNMKQFISEDLKDRVNHFTQRDIPRSELPFEIVFEEDDEKLGLEDEFVFDCDLQYTNQRMRRASEPPLRTATTSISELELEDAFERSSSSNLQISSGTTDFIFECEEDIVNVKIGSTLHLKHSSIFKNCDQLSRPLYQLCSNEELDSDDISLGNTLKMELEGGNQIILSQNSKDSLERSSDRSKKSSRSIDRPSGTPDSPRKKKQTGIEEPLLQNLPGLQSIRVLNGFDEKSVFDSVDIIDPVGENESLNTKRYINYSYEIGPRSHANAYEPSVVRKKRTDFGIGGGSEGLCPYCPQMRFLSMKTSAYLHHMTTQHGVFSNGVLVEEPGACIRQVLANNGKKKNVEFFTCPYECELKLIRMKKINPLSPMECRYKVYLRHVKDCHGCGKRDNQMKRD